MAHREELLAAVLAAWGNAHLRGVPVPWTALEADFDADLTGASGRRSRVRFADAVGGRGGAPAPWLAEGVREGVGRFAVVAPPQAPPARVGGAEVSQAALHAFAGTGGLVLAAAAPDGVRRYRSRVWFPPRTAMTAKDVLAFVGSQGSAAELREALLWQDEHNLRVTDGSDWEAFVAALRPEHDEALVGATGRAVNNVRFTHGEAQAWAALVRAHPNPAFAWQCDFVRVEDAESLPAADDVATRTGRLEAALSEIEGFAVRIGEASWASVFRRARSILGGAEFPGAIPGRLEAAGLAPAALRLLAASLQADVFGGMGSWNDLGPDDAEGYARVSARLFAELRPALASACS